MLCLDENFKFFFIFLGIFQFTGDAAVILTDLACLLSQFLLFAFDPAVTALNFIFFFLNLGKIHLCGILLDILLLQLLLEISNGISKYITSAAVFTDRTLRLFKFFLEDSDAFLQFFNLTSSSEQITVIFECTTCHGTARA